MSKERSFERAREDAHTEETEVVECEYCGDGFKRPVDTEYCVCSKRCARDARAEFYGKD